VIKLYKLINRYINTIRRKLPEGSRKYVQLICRDVDKVVEEAKRAGLRVYKGKKHITVTDGVYRARIYIPMR